MNHIVLIAAIGLLPTTTVFAQTASAPLIVVEDRGGDSALPYYRSLNPQPDQATPP
ncbi:TPA: integrating conjugative element protein, partial [Pseudomonas aeruginosa]|nr:integrating conjugative element protein [Pseudomonas aeruginosa]